MKYIIKSKKGGSDKNWIQKAVNPAHKGYCTPMTKSTCTPKRKALAKTFKKMAKKREDGGEISYKDGIKNKLIPKNQQGAKIISGPTVTSRKDPKFIAYRDSLNLYNKYKNEINYINSNMGENESLYKVNTKDPGSFHKYTKGTKGYKENLDYIESKEGWDEVDHPIIKPTTVYETGEWPFTGLRVYQKPTLPVTVANIQPLKSKTDIKVGYNKNIMTPTRPVQFQNSTPIMSRTDIGYDNKPLSTGHYQNTVITAKKKMPVQTPPTTDITNLLAPWKK